MLMELFASKYRSVKGAKVIIDANTGRSRGYGFVRFGDDNDKTHAMTEMNGVYCSTRSIRVGPATPRRSSGISNEYCLYVLSLFSYMSDLTQHFLFCIS
jgi:RNA recognition motif-containing protein